LISLSLPLRPERDQQKWKPVLRPIALQIKKGRMIWSPNRQHFGGSCAWHRHSIFIGFPRSRVDIPQPAGGRRRRSRRLEANVGSGFRKRKRELHKFVRGGAAAGNLLKGRMIPIPPVQIASLYRYPVKGLSPEPLSEVALTVGQTLPADRRYAVENGPTGFDPAEPKWRPKTHYLMLMRDERLAALHTRFDDANHVLTIRRDGEIVAQGDLETTEGRTTIERFFAADFTSELKGPPKVLSGGGYSFSDVSKKVVSIINLSSVAAIEDIVGQPVNPLRFRANLYVRGWPAWREFELLDQTLAIGDVRLKVMKRIVRCAATNVDPATGVRDLNIPHALMRRFGHADCGVYAEVIAGGSIAAGDDVAVSPLA
jgi:uncharacterized protein